MSAEVSALRILSGLPESLGRARLWLFIATGLAVPLYAFPVMRLFGKPLDLATVFAALFVLVSVPAAASQRPSRGSRLFLAGAVLVPLLVLAPPRPALFSFGQFAISYGHWLLVVSFFLSALLLTLGERDRRRLIGWNLAVGFLVALFALYQVVGVPRGWPGTGTALFAFQREPLHLWEGSGYVRPTSIFLEPSWVGGYLCWILAAGLPLLLAAPAFGRRVPGPLIGVALATISLAILASLSVGAYADLTAVLIVNMVVLPKRLHLTSRRALAAASVAVLLIALAAASPPGRRAATAASKRWAELVASTSVQIEDSPNVRTQNFLYTVKVFRHHWTRGIGFGQFGRYARESETGSTPFADAWCGWVAIAAQAGILGPLVLAGAIGLVLTRLRSRRSKDFVGPAVAALIAIAAVQQFHTGSYIDLWWWYPLSLAGVIAERGKLVQIDPVHNDDSQLP